MNIALYKYRLSDEELGIIEGRLVKIAFVKFYILGIKL